MSIISNNEWLNRNEQRAYPLTEDGDRRADTGWILPDDLLVDLSIVGYDLGGGVCLESVTVTPALLSFSLAGAAGARCLAVALAISGKARTVPLKPFASGISGQATFGRGIDRIAEFPRGIHRFLGAPLLEARTQLELGEPPVSSLNGLSGQISIKVGNELRVATGKGQADNGDQEDLIALSLKRPGKFLSPCENPTTLCDCPTTPIQSINGVVPDENGNITLALQDANGQILPYPALLQLLVLRSSASICPAPQPLPDALGQIPLADGTYR